MFFAILASLIAKKAGGNLKQFESRTSKGILLLGALVNICVLLITLLLLKVFDRRSIATLGLSFSDNDIAFSIVGTVITFMLVSAFVGLLGRSGRFHVRIQKPVKNLPEALTLGVVIFVLLIVALQEEVLFRGYITLNLLPLGPVVVIIVSTILFSVVHLLTNRANFYQIVSWLLAGAILSYTYLVSGSIWVPIILHFGFDLANVLVLNIVERFAILKTVPKITDKYRMRYRVVCTTALLVALLAFYTSTIRIV
jgi:membrane protease YdiL (CAAX protease family)